MKRTFIFLLISSALLITACKTTSEIKAEDEKIIEDTQELENQEEDYESEDYELLEEVEIVPEVEHLEEAVISRNLSDEGVLCAEELFDFFMEQNPEADPEMIQRMSKYYIEECDTEGINSDCAWAQMCLETGYLRFGNLVQPEFHNYCGLGAIDEEHPGEIFETEELGIRAHIQHLFAYAKTEENQLINELIDKRFKWVNPKGKAPTIFELAGTWAADRAYGTKLDAILTKMELSTRIE